MRRVPNSAKNSFVRTASDAPVEQRLRGSILFYGDNRSAGGKGEARSSHLPGSTAISGPSVVARLPYCWAMTSRVIPAIAAAILAIEAVVVGVTVANARTLLLPVTVDLDGGITLATVNLGVAAIVLLAFSALCRGVSALWPAQVIRWIEWSQVSAVTVFLIAQLNGIRDVAALVVLYALTAAASLFLLVHERSGGRWPFAYGAAVGIVPWGVIALYQIGAIVAGDDPAPIIRVITIAMLAVAAGYWFVAFRYRVTALAQTVLVTAHVSLFAWLAMASLHQSV